MSRVLLMALVVASVLAGGSAHAQTDSRVMRFVVPAPPGGPLDPYARIIADHMSKTLGRTIIVENKVGANGIVAAQYMMSLPADGTALFIGTAAMMEIIPVTAGKLPWTADTFRPLIKGVESFPVLVVHPSVPATTFKEFVDWARSKPGKLSYSSWGAGTPSAFLGFQLGERFGLDLTHVPYRGSAPQTTDLIAGHQLLGFAQAQQVLEPVRAGHLKAIATTTPGRSRFFPATPSFAELGHPEFTTSVWFGLMVLDGTPPETVAMLTDAAKKAHADPDIKNKFEQQGLEVSGQTGPEVAADIKTQVERWGRIVKATGYKSE